MVETTLLAAFCCSDNVDKYSSYELCMLMSFSAVTFHLDRPGARIISGSLSDISTRWYTPLKFVIKSRNTRKHQRT